MSYTGGPNEKAVPAGELNRAHVGQTVSFEGNDTTVVFGRIAAVARRDDGVYVALAGVAGSAHLESGYLLAADQHVYVQPDVLTSTEAAFKDFVGKVQDNLRGTRKPDDA